MADVKTAAAKNTGSHAGKPKNGNNFMMNLGIVVACIAISWGFFLGVMKNAGHDTVLGKMYLGGPVVPMLMGTLLTLITFIIERALTIVKAKGKIDGAEFVRKVQYHLANKNVDAAIAECDKQSGSVGNVMRAGLTKYKEMISNTELDTDQKVANIQKEIEEATALELPMMEKNLVFLSTIASVATLLGLLGTV